MQYLLQFTYRDGEGPEEGTPEFDAEMEVWHALNEELQGVRPVARRERPEARGRDHRPQARRRGPVTDGPFAETKEILFSFYMLDVEDLDAAIAVAAQDARHGVRLGDIRPMVGLDSRERRGGPLERAFRDERAAVLATDHAPAGRRPRAGRGRRPGRVRRRGGRLGPPRRPGAPRRVADDDGVAQGARPPAPRAGRRRLRARGADDLRVRLRRLVAGRRPAGDAVHLLPPGARARGADGADAAQRGGADGAGDRARVPLERGRDGAAARAGAATRSPTRASRSRCPPTTCCPSGWRACCASST